MARPGITYLEVESAIARLKGQEESITIDNIRGLLKTGSRSTIANHLKTWRERKGGLEVSDSTLPDDLQHLLKGLWENMRGKAKETIAQHQAEANEKTAEANQELEAAKLQLADSQKQGEETSSLLQQKTDHADNLQTKLNFEQQETQKLNERITSLETRHQDAADENKKLHEHIKNLHVNLEHYQATTQKKQEEQSLQLDKQRQAQEQTERALKQEISQLGKTNTKLVTEKENLAQQLYAITEQHKQLDKTHRETEKQFNQALTRYEILEPKHQSLQKHHQEAEEALLTKRLEVERLQAELTTQSQLIDGGKIQLTQALENYKKLEDDYKQYQQLKTLPKEK